MCHSQPYRGRRVYTRSRHTSLAGHGKHRAGILTGFFRPLDAPPTGRNRHIISQRPPEGKKKHNHDKTTQHFHHHDHDHHNKSTSLTAPPSTALNSHHRNHCHNPTPVTPTTTQTTPTATTPMASTPSPRQIHHPRHYYHSYHDHRCSSHYHAMVSFYSPGRWAESPGCPPPRT